MPELTYSHDSKNGVTIFDATGHRYEHESNVRGKPTLRLKSENAVLVVDRLDLNSERDRTRFANRTNGLSEKVKRELVALSELHREQPVTHAANRSPATISMFPLTDLGNAERLVQMHGHNLRYCHPWNRWFGWDRVRWREDDTGAVIRLAKSTVRSIYREAADTDDDAVRKDLAKHARASEARSRIDAMIDLASSETGIPVLPDELDTDHWLLNVQNGTVDLRTGELRGHQREDLITRVLPVEYDPEASAPAFLSFLERIFAGNLELIAFVRRVAGYILTGDTSEQCIFIFHGTGANGKSTLIKILIDLLGEYASQTSTDTLLAKRNDTVPNDIAALRGARLVAATETEDGRRLAESLVKQLTGGDRIAARFMRAEWFEFVPTFKIIMATNHKPVIRGTDHAIWRRIRLVPFDVTIPDDQQDRRLPEKLQEELPGILAWAVQGCLEWQREGLGVPDVVVQATNEYRSDMDVLGGWINDRCVISPEMATPAKELYASYTSWCDENGEHAMAQQALGRRLKERGFEQVKTKHARMWQGLGLKADKSGDAFYSVTLCDTNSSINEGHENSRVLSGKKRHKASPQLEASPENAEISQIRRWLASGLIATVDVPVRVDGGARFYPDDLRDTLEMFLSKTSDDGPPGEYARSRLIQLYGALKPMIEGEAA